MREDRLSNTSKEGKKNGRGDIMWLDIHCDYNNKPFGYNLIIDIRGKGNALLINPINKLINTTDDWSWAKERFMWPHYFCLADSQLII